MSVTSRELAPGSGSGCGRASTRLIILDLDMPRLTGRELVAALRADSSFARIPLVSMTGGPAPVDLPTRAHLAKPFAFARLLEILFAECRRCALCDGDGRVVGSIFETRSRLQAAPS